MKREAFIYTWSTEDIETDTTQQFKLRMYGIDNEHNNVCVHVEDFMPYFYIELEGVESHEITTWFGGIKRNLLQCLNKHDASECKRDGCSFCWKGRIEPVPNCKKLYFYHAHNNFTFLKVSFCTNVQRKKAYYRLQEKEIIVGYRSGKSRILIHENEANPVLQFCTQQKLPSAGWIKWKKNQQMDVMFPIKQTLCSHEIHRSFKEIKALSSEEEKNPPNPYVLSFDIEVYSSVPSRMPDPEMESDVLFQISMVFSRDMKQFKEYLLSLGKPLQHMVGSNVILLCYESEKDLILGFNRVVQKESPNVIIGYNIFGFDINYLIVRAKMHGIMHEFDQMGMRIRNGTGFPVHAPEKEISWSSSAYSHQKFFFLDTEGRLFIDLLPVVRRDYKFENYRLKTISEAFLGDTKDPITPKDIFASYAQAQENTPKRYHLLSRVGKYCVQDSKLVLRLFDRLQTWIGLCEMAKTCRIPILGLYTQGQQIRVFSQLYFECTHQQIIVQSPHSLGKQSDKIKGPDHFSGAMVFPPDPGVYDWVIPFDFSSLYPTTIIAYNIDFSTLVLDKHIPDQNCHVIEWWDHIGCSHDTTVHATKPKHEICQKFKYRFLKEPQGVLPRLLVHLLNARKNTKNQMKEASKLLADPNLSAYEKSRLETLYQVYDKRQLAYKVSANSMYGSMGVQKGYLPFFPGAMCTTAMGRENIQKAAKHVKKHFDGKIVYGDSVASYTPIMIFYRQKFEILSVEELASKYGKNQWIRCIGKEEKESCEMPFGLQTWTEKGFTDLKRIIRHRLIPGKKMIRVLTDRGLVDCTDDHSLLCVNGKPISPKNATIGMPLLHKWVDIPFQTNYIHFTPILVKEKAKSFWEEGQIEREFAYKLLSGEESWQRLFWNESSHKKTFRCKNWWIASFYMLLCRQLGINIRLEEDDGIFIFYFDQISSTSFQLKKLIELKNYKGFVYDLTTENHHFAAGIGSLIVHNTDSIYCHFPLPAKEEGYALELWKHAKMIEKDLIKIFPNPMKLVFEEKIYKKFLILTKKRYMALTCDHKGEDEDVLTIRGVLLARRDNARWVRGVYERLVRSVMAGVSFSDLLNRMNDDLLSIFRFDVALKQLIISKTLGKDYAIRELPEEGKKKKKRLEDLGIDETKAGWKEEYVNKSKPAHVQLAEKMKKRGVVVEPGSRIEFVIVTHPKSDPKQFERIEDPTYIREHGDLVRPDPLYYAQNLINPVDQIFSVCFRKEKVLEKIVGYHIQFKKLMSDLILFFHPVCFEHFDGTKEIIGFTKSKRISKKKITSTTKSKVDQKKKDDSKPKTKKRSTVSTLQLAQDLLSP